MGLGMVETIGAQIGSMGVCGVAAMAQDLLPGNVVPLGTTWYCGKFGTRFAVCSKRRANTT